MRSIVNCGNLRKYNDVYPMKGSGVAIMSKNLKHRLKGPAQFIAAFLIVITTYWYWHRIPTCWVGYDIFCHTAETSTFILKCAAAASQILGIFLLIYSLDSKMNLLRGDGLKEYIAKKWSAWVIHPFLIDAKSRRLRY